MDGDISESKPGQPESRPGQPESKPCEPESKTGQSESKPDQLEPKPGHLELLTALDDSLVPNGFIMRRHTPLDDPTDDERVGVLDYMPKSRNVTELASRPDEPKNIELTTFRITECRDHRNPVTCPSCGSDDELLGAGGDDYLHEVVVQSSRGDDETSPLLRCIPSSFGAMRDAARSRLDIGRGSPPDDGDAVERDLEEDTFTTFRVSAHDGGCVAMTAVDVRNDQAVEDRSLQHDSATSVVVDNEVDPEVQTGSSGLPPVEVVSVDRSPMDPGSISRSNVLYLNDYSLWTNAARAFCRDEPASDRSEVEKRQERRDKRRERRGHERTVKAEEIEGYMGMKEVMDLVEYIQGEAGRREMGKTTSKRGKESETSVTVPLQGDSSKSSETLQRKPTQKHKALKKATSLRLPEMVEQGESAGVGTGKVSMVRSRSEENADEDSTSDQPDDKDSSSLVEVEWIRSSTLKALGRASTRSDFHSPEPEKSTAEFCSATLNSHTGKVASKTDDCEQMPGSKKSKKQNNRKNRGAQVSDLAQQGSRANSELSSTTGQSFLSPQPNRDTCIGTSEGGPVYDTDMALTESLLSADATGEDAGHQYGYPYKSPSVQEKVQDVDDTWTVHTRKHAKPRVKLGDGETRTSSQGELHPIVWKDQPGRPVPAYRKPDCRVPFGRVGSVGDGCQGSKFSHLSVGSGRAGPGSTSSLDLEGYNCPGKVGSRTFWGSRDWKESLKMSDAPRNFARFPNRSSCVDGDDVESKKEESITYARITAGEPTYSPPMGVDMETPGQSSPKFDGAIEVPSQTIEADLPPDRKKPDAPNTRSDGDSPSRTVTETGGTGIVFAPKDQPSGGTTVASMVTKQVASDAAPRDSLSEESSRGVDYTSSNSKREDHSRVPDETSSDVGMAKVSVTETESKANLLEEKPDVVPIDKNPGGHCLPKMQGPVVQQKRNPETKAKALPVEFSKRFKGTRVDGISFCFDPTVTDSRSQGSPPSFSALDSSNTGGGTISGRLVSGPTYSTTTVVLAGGGLQSQGSAGTSVTNCSRPIAPLSGTAHASGTRTPVVVVNPMQLVARVSAEGPSHTITGSGDTDPEILKEVTIPTGTVRIDDQRMVMSTSPVFPSITDDMTRANITDTPARKTIARRATFANEPQREEAVSATPGSPFAHRSQQQSDPRSKHPEPLHLYDSPQQKFVSPSVYVLYRPCANCPQPDVCHQGPVGSPQPEAAPFPPQRLCQPRDGRETNCTVQPQLVVPITSLFFIQDYIHSEFQKVLMEEKHDSSKVVRFRED